MKKTIKKLLSLSILAGQLCPVNAAQAHFDGARQVVAEKYSQFKSSTKNVARAIKKHPLVALWGVAGAIAVGEVVVRMKKKIEDEREIRWYNRMQAIVPSLLAPQEGAVQIARQREDEWRRVLDALVPLTDLDRAGQAGTCPVCCDNLDLKGDSSSCNGLVNLHCNHQVCHNCLQSIIQGVITSHNIEQSRCPQCSVDGTVRSLTQADVRQVLGGDQAWPELEILRRATQANAKPCPTPNCRYVHIPQENEHDFTCPKCTGHYCIQCSVNHTPAQASCKDIERFIKQGDRLTDNWIMSNTQPCPNCSNAIEKNGGCFHMICSNCNYHFCWNCLGRWYGHGNYYRCGLARAG